MKYLVTGAAGFIGSATVKKLNQLGHTAVGIDNLSDYYDVSLKQARLLDIKHDLFKFVQLDITDIQALSKLFAKENFDRVIHLAAQPGVRYSLENPHAYIDANILGYFNVLEACRRFSIEHLIYASSSSVYGLNKKVPFSTADAVDHPVSLYAATKKSNELIAHSYSHLFNLPTTGLRFFTVYGAWGRPDMAPFIFTQKMINNQAIDINNHGELWRDFTHVIDIVEGIVRIADVIPDKNALWEVESGDAATSSAPYRIYNIGRGESIHLMQFIDCIEKELGIVAKKNFHDMQPGDVFKTYADTENLFQATGYKPVISLAEGVADFIRWFKAFYEIKCG